MIDIREMCNIDILEDKLYYYENKMKWLIYLLNNTNDTDVTNYLLNEYYTTYNNHELLYKIINT